MRLFIALNIPDDLREAIYTATAPLRAIAPGARWTGAEKLHLTMKFLGERPQELVDALVPALDALGARHRAIDLRIEGLGAFPNARRPRIVWAGIVETPALSALQGDVDDACARLGIEREDRPFHPHVTLARIGPRVPHRDAQALLRERDPLGLRGAAVVRTVDLMQSVGGRYVPLHRATLAA